MNMLVAEGANRHSGTTSTKRARSIRRHWLVAASAGAIAAATPGYMGFYGGRARAQLPPTCSDEVTAGTPNDGDRVIEDGETITCLDPAGTASAPLGANVDDLTVVVGDDTTEGNLGNGSGDALFMYGYGAQTLTVVNAGSRLYGSEDGAEIIVRGGEGGLTIESAGELRGSKKGVNATNNGAGATSITTADVYGRDDAAIRAANDFSATSLTIDTTAGTVVGVQGINVENNGTGETRITTGNVTARDIANRNVSVVGISASTESATTGLTINTVAGAVNSAGDGIYADHAGSGAMTITTGNVTATGRYGIRAESPSGGGAVIIDTSAGTVQGVNAGLKVGQENDALLSIKVDDVTGGVGIFTSAQDGATEITLISTALVQGTTGAGVEAQSDVGDITLKGSSGRIIGATDGVIMFSDGALTVQNLDAVTGQGGDGLELGANKDGAVTITSIDAVTGSAGAGIYTLTEDGDITIADVTNITGVGDAGAQIANGHGVRAVSDGGDISIQRVGLGDGNLVEGRDGHGIYAYTEFGEVNIGGEVDSVTGEVIGAVGNVTGSRHGVFAKVDSGGPITINTSAGAVTGGEVGIYAYSSSGSVVSVTARDVTSLAGGGAAIRATSTSNDVTIITTGVVSGANQGIFAHTAGAGAAIDITTARVTSVSDDGIYTFNSTNGAAITINTSAGEVDGAQRGINAFSQGVGVMTITVNDVTGRSGEGILARSRESTAHITVQGSSGDVVGGEHGIFARAYGANVTVQTLDSVTGQGHHGIETETDGLGEITISSITAIDGENGSGIRAEAADGSITISDLGSVTGASNRAIDVETADGDITISNIASVAIDALGEGRGVQAYSRNGAIEITSVGAASGRSGAGMHVVGVYGDVSIQGSGLAGGITSTGQADGIYVRSRTGDVTLGGEAALGDVTGGDDGVEVRIAPVSPGAAVSGDLTIDTSAGAVDGARRGINTTNEGGGVTTITVNDVTGQSEAGIFAQSEQSTAHITVQGASGDVIGGTDGIYMRSAGANITVQTLDSVTGQGGHGVDADAGDGAVTISDVTTIVGYGDTTTPGDQGHGVKAVSSNGGVSIQNVGTGTNGLVEGREGHGIYARALARGAGGVNIGGLEAIGNVTGSRHGIDARVAYTGGDLTIDTSGGAVTGGAIGINAIQYGGDGLSLTVDDVIGDLGVYAKTGEYGETEITLTSTAVLQSRSTMGVDVNAFAGDILLQGLSGGEIYGATKGVRLQSGAKRGGGPGGNITVRNLDSIIGNGSDAITARTYGGDSVITVSGVDTLIGRNSSAPSAIEAFSNGGAISIQGSGLVGGIRGDSVSILASAAGGDINIGGETPNGKIYGAGNSGRAVVATTHGDGSIVIALTDTAAVNNPGFRSPAIWAESENGDISITSTALISTGGFIDSHAVYARTGGGDFNIMSTGSIVSTGTDSNGVDVAVENDGAINVTVAELTAEGGAGVYARAADGETVITLGSTGDVEGGDGAGVDAASTGAEAHVTVQGSSGDITGSTHGTYLRTAGADITVQKLDSVTGQGGHGLDLASYGGDITVSRVTNITGYGDNANPNEGHGVKAISDGGDISIQGVGVGEGALVDGRDGHGVYARSGTGDLNIGGVEAIGNVTASQDGVNAENGAGAGLSVTVAGTINAGRTGVWASNNGVGATVVNVADISAANGDKGGNGILVRNDRDSEATDIIVNVTGHVIVNSGTRLAGTGIIARNFGTGGTSITTGDVTSLFGINVNSGYTTTGDVVVDTTNGTVTSTFGDGIQVGNLGQGDVSITTADINVAGGVWVSGIDAKIGVNGFDNNLTIDTTAGAVYTAVGAVLSSGISTVNSGSSGRTSITVGDVTGGYGIAAFGRFNSSSNDVGDGDVDITLTSTATGAARVTGWYRDGVYASSIGGNILLQGSSGGYIVGAVHGVRQRSNGGNITVQTLDSVTGEGGYGLDLDSGGGDITISDVTTITGNPGAYYSYSNSYFYDGHGVRAVSSGGDISIQNVGVGDGALVDGRGGSGLYVRAGAGGVNIGGEAPVGNVKGSLKGIDAHSEGAGETVIRIAGAVAGETEEGVRAATASGASVIVEDGGSVTGGAAAIVTDSSVAAGDPVNDMLTINAGGSVTGDALLLAGDDTFNEAGGSFTNVLGGDGVDTVTFSGPARAIGDGNGAGDAFSGFEIANFLGGGQDITGALVNFDEATFVSGETRLSGSLEATTALIASGATLNAADGSILTGVLTNNGTLDVGDSPGTFTVNGNLVLGATGVLPIEIGATSDLVVVAGDVTLGGTLEVITLAGAPFGVSTRTIIDGGTGVSGAFDTVNAQNGLLISQAIDVDAANFDVVLTTTVNTASSVNGLNKNQIAVGDNLIGLLGDPSLHSGLLSVINAVGGIEDVDALGDALGELTPEGLDLGLKFLSASQSRFIGLALSQASIAGGARHSARLASLSGGPVAAASGGDAATAWGAMEVYGLSQDGGTQHIDFDGSAFSFAAGVSGIAAGPFSFGIAGGYSNFDGEVDGAFGDAADADLFHIAGTASARFGFSAFDARLDSVVGYATGDTELAMTLGDPATDETVVQRGDAGVSSVDWLTRLTLDGRTGGDAWALKPHLQTGVAVYRQDAINLGAAETTALAVDGLNNTRWQIGVGATYERRVAGRLSLSARATGVQYFDDTENIFASRFAAAPAGSPSFRTTGRAVDRQVQLDAALAYAHKSGFVVSVGAFGETGDLTLYGGSVNVQKRF